MDEVELKDRIISALSYLTAGWIGLIYFIIIYFMKKPTTRFLRYNVLQSIFLAFALFIISEICKIVFGILLLIPFINMLFSSILLLLNKSFIFHYSLIQLALGLFFIYLSGMSFLGKYPKVYWVSENIIVKASR